MLIKSNNQFEPVVILTCRRWEGNRLAGAPRAVYGPNTLPSQLPEIGAQPDPVGAGRTYCPKLVMEVFPDTAVYTS